MGESGGASRGCDHPQSRVIDRLREPKWGRGLWEVWHNVIRAYEAYHWAEKQQTYLVGVVCTPPKQKLLLAFLQEVICCLPIGAHKKLQETTVMVEPRRNLKVLGEKLTDRTLYASHLGVVSAHTTGPKSRSQVHDLQYTAKWDNQRKSYTLLS